MKFREYLAVMNAIAKDNPKSLDYDMVCAADDEGNWFQKVNFHPCAGHFDGESYRTASEAEEEGLEVNCVCVN